MSLVYCTTPHPVHKRPCGTAYAPDLKMCPHCWGTDRTDVPPDQRLPPEPELVKITPDAVPTPPPAAADKK